jgi:hypothetical protein
VALIPSLQGLPSRGYDGKILAESNVVAVPVLPITLEVASPSALNGTHVFGRRSMLAAMHLIIKAPFSSALWSDS